MTTARLRHRREALLELIAEVLLSFLPMVLVIITLHYMGKPEKVFQKPEWAFAAAIFFGQAVVRLVSAISNSHDHLRAGILALVVVLFILIGLGPSCAIVVLVLFANDISGTAQLPALSGALQATQVVLYLLSAISYIFVGVVARELENKGKSVLNADS